MTYIFWLLIFIQILPYVIVLILLNCSKYVTVKYIAWLSLRQVTIRLKTTKIHIRKISLRFNFFRSNETSGLKLINLEIVDVEVTTLESGQQAGHDTPAKPAKTSKGGSLSRAVTFHMSKKIYSFIESRICNRINIHVFRLAVKGKTSIFCDYTRLQVTINEQHDFRFTITMLSGLIAKDKKQNTHLLRNLEFYIDCNSVTTCNDQNRVSLQLINFKFALSIGRLNLPLEYLELSKPRKEVSKGPKELPDLLKYVGLLQEFLDFFSSAEIRLEDFTLSHKQLSINLTSIISLTKIDKDTYSNFKLSWYLTSFKLYHKETQCVEIPSGTLNHEFDPLEAVRVMNALLHRQESQDTINFNISLILTSPTIDVYYDQQEILFAIQRNKMMKRMQQSTVKNDMANEILMTIVQMIRSISGTIDIVDTHLNIHLPARDSKHEDFNRNSKSNLIFKCSLSDLMGKIFTRRRRNKTTIDSLIKLKEFRSEVEGNRISISKITSLITYNVLSNTVAIRVASKIVRMKSVNDMFFHIVRQYRNQQRIFNNEKYKEWIKSADYEAFIENNHTFQPVKSDYLQLFEIIPSIVTSINVKLGTILLDIICKEGLPSHMIYDENLQKEVDLADFRRGISLRIKDTRFIYKSKKEHVELTSNCVELYTLSEYDSEYIEDFDQVTEYSETDSEYGDLSSIETSNDIEDEEDEREDECTKRIKRVLSISGIDLSNKHKSDDINKLILTVPSVDARIDMFFVWCIFYAKTMVERFAPTVESNCSKDMLRQIAPRKKIKLDVNLDSVALVTRLPRKVDILIEVDTAQFRNVSSLKSVDIGYARLYVIQPATKLWARLVVITQTKLNIDLRGKTDITPASIRFNVPNRFLMYTVIDNLITFFKAIKQLKHNFWGVSLEFDKFERCYPSQKLHPMKFPCIRIRTNILGLALENDAFENELAMIYELGIVEHKERLRKLKIFEKKAEEILSQAQEEDIEHKIELSEAVPFGPRLNEHRPHSPNPFKAAECKISQSTARFKERVSKLSRKPSKPAEQTSSDPEEPPLSYTVADALDQIEAARSRLYENMSTAWVNRYRFFRKEKTESWRTRTEAVWGKDEIRTIIKQKFSILAYAQGAPLMGAVFRDVDLTLDKFNDGDLDEFIYNNARKQPKLKYSILAPFHIDLVAKKLYMFLRDYPLPLISFPPNSDASKPTIHLQGNIVINEKLYEMQEELRYIFVPFSPACIDNGKADNFYSVYVPRTLTPVKMIANIQCDLNTDRACMISFCKSYTPSLSLMFRAFDNFTKPAIDDSPIGWWDKVPLILHGRIQFNVHNELCLHMKSSTDPYALVGDAAGFVFCWKNNVELAIDGNIDSRKLITLSSDDFLFVIPNYGASAKEAWSLFYDDKDDLTNLVDGESKKYLKRVIKLSSKSRVKWTFGMMFERNKHESNNFSDNELRTSEFKPHYEVIVTNPANSYHPDSYKDYRSHYIHMALAVISNSDTGHSYNAAHLTPLTFQYFFRWWDLLLHHTVMPVRNGNLYKGDSLKKKSVSMGKHLFTIKYQLVFNPVIISHMYLHASNDVPDKNNRVQFTGLKSRFTKFEVDMHQRRELITYVNKKLNKRTQVRHLKMNQVEVSTENMDVRLIRATFPDRCVTSKVAQYVKGELMSSASSSSSSDGSLNGRTFSDWMADIDSYNQDYSWLDQEDFIELEVKEPLSPYPKIRIVPFLFTPKFSYFREFTKESEGPFPFGNEPIHDCLMDLEKPAAVQRRILQQRIDRLEDELESQQKLLDRYKLNASPEFEDDIKNLETNILSLNEKIEVVSTARDEFIEEQVDDEDGTSLSKQTSRLSAYSGHLSNDILDGSVSQFHNRFIIHNLQMKWDNQLRDYFLCYLGKVGDRKNNVFFMSKAAVDLVESIINEQQQEEDGLKPESIKQHRSFDPSDFKTSEQVINSFHDEFDQVNEDEEVDNKYLIKLIHPQIQLVSKKNPDACVLITVRDLEIRIIGVNMRDMVNTMDENTENCSMVERRYGVLLKDEQIFVVCKNSIVEKTDPMISNFVSGYSTGADNWPPWFECEVCYQGNNSINSRYMVSDRSTKAVMYKQKNPLFVEASSRSVEKELVVYLGKFVINATSDQYSCIYYVYSDLLFHTRTSKDDVTGRLKKVMALSDSTDFHGLDIRVKTLQDQIREYSELLLSFDVKRAQHHDFEKESLAVLQVELVKLKFELMYVMKGISLRFKSKQISSSYWNVLADQIIWHFLDDNREPFVDFALGNTRFTRTESADGTNVNNLQVSFLQGFNLQKDALYPQLLTPYESAPDGKRLLNMSWTLMEPIGGIRIVKDAKVEIQPLQLELEFSTAKKLVSYLFPKDDSVDMDDSQEHDDFDDIFEQEEEGYASETSSNKSNSSKNPIKRLIQKSKPSSSNWSANASTSVSDNMSPRNSSEMSSITSFSNDEFSEGTKTKTKKSTRLKKKRIEDDEDNLALVTARSAKYKSIIHVEIVKFILVVSFRGPKNNHLLDVNQLQLNVPNLTYNHKIWSGEDLMNRIKKDIIKMILQHTGKILGNKFKIPKKRSKLSEPLKQISNYGKLLTLDDLQQQHQGRDSMDSLDSPRSESPRVTPKPHVIKKMDASDATFSTYFRDDSSDISGDDEMVVTV
ncbi:uncharacterized protein SPAPADRAFT_147282 [Spathaspora passalidarum NRRL Y-27907]|uniref:Uncharacterized protein n=1 Tax=Spathaspora passalidarum (strain NRRL Y-27907 / 11-Y1) TaxID=619300 RepID=G3AED3_SPAPN|nr:uncharacterized protein SPAPADRAFT_147282 [Spathaspora passalidarum NRRL Y-27907]EGW35721.1 hypothetical protein SPAPADRAFT_147282 [Spathaspora passalidarum NRRL Y-27907]